MQGPAPRPASLMACGDSERPLSKFWAAAGVARDGKRKRKDESIKARVARRKVSGVAPIGSEGSFLQPTPVEGQGEEEEIMLATRSPPAMSKTHSTLIDHDVPTERSRYLDSRFDIRQTAGATAKKLFPSPAEGAWVQQAGKSRDLRYVLEEVIVLLRV